jgi:adenosylcobinamide-GDP ribazoletransferase
VLFAAVSTVLPLLLTGGMHMDGFMDTVDAIGSRQPRERKLEIMKDSHCGAFAVLYCGIYLLISFGLYHALYASAALPAICIGFVLSRALAVVFALTMPNARGGGLLFTFSENSRGAGAIVAMCLISLLCLCGMAVVSKAAGVAVFIASLIALLVYRQTAMRQFSGATGDTTGFFIQLSELCMLIGAFVGSLL